MEENVAKTSRLLYSTSVASIMAVVQTMTRGGGGVEGTNSELPSGDDR